MPSKFRVRRIFRGLVSWIANPLAAAGVRPNTITHLSLLLAFIAGLLLNLTGSPVMFGIFIFLSGLFDGVDGAIARKQKTASDFGAFVDSISDKVSEVIILGSIAVEYVGQFFIGIPIEWWVVIALAGWLLTSYTRSRASSLGAKDLDIGLGGRSERLLTLVIFSVLNQLFWGLVLVSIMGIFTAAYRFYKYQNEIAQLSKLN